MPKALTNEEYIRNYLKGWGPTAGQVEYLTRDQWRPPLENYMELTYCAILTELTMCWFDSGNTMTISDYINLMYIAEEEHAKGNGWTQKSENITEPKTKGKNYQNHHTYAKTVEKYGTSTHTKEQPKSGTPKSQDSLNTDAIVSNVQTALKMK